MKTRFTFLFLFFLAANALWAQKVPNAQQLKDFDIFINKVIKEWKVPALGIGIVKGDKIILAKGYGFRDVSKELSANENTLFAIGSSSKAFTAFSLCQLADDGILKMDEPLLTLLPDFRMHDDYATQRMTARDLLCHNSGLPRHDFTWYGSESSREDFYKNLHHLEPSADFRQAFQYQNLMFLTAGYLLERLGGQPWEAFVQQRIFTPLGMKRANLSVTDMTKDDNHALPYRLQKEQVTAIPFRNIDAVAPAGAINASAQEMCNWLIAQLNGGKFGDQQLITEARIAEMHSPHSLVTGAMAGYMFADNGGAPIAYGLGWFLAAHKNRRAVFHGGNIDGFSAMVGLLPEDKIGVVVLSNLDGNMLPTIIRNYVFDMMLNEKPRDWNSEILATRKALKESQKAANAATEDGRVANTNPTHPLGDYVGNYEHPSYGKVAVELKDNQLSASFHGMDLKLEHFHYDVFQTKSDLLNDYKIQFHTDVNGKIGQLDFPLEAAVKPIVFERAANAPNYTTEQLQAFVGKYQISTMVVTIALRDDKTLTMSVPGQPEYELLPFGENEFELKDLKGFRAVFNKAPEDAVAKELVMHQPNGIFKTTRLD